MVLNQILVNQVSFVVRNGCDFRLRASKGEKRTEVVLKRIFYFQFMRVNF